MKLFIVETLLCIGVIVACMVHCTPEVSGPSTEQGNPQIVAIVVDDAHHPVPGAAVTTYLNSTSNDPLALPASAIQVASRVTDRNGHCSFEQLPAGNYSITASDQYGTRRAIRLGVTLLDPPATTRSVDTLQLQKTGTVRGVVTRSTESPTQGSNQQLKNGAIMVIIQEIALSFTTPADGSYQFTNLPPGTYTIMYYATNGYHSAQDTVRVFTDSITDRKSVV